MKILCGGVIDGPTPVFAHSLNIDCLDATPASSLAAELYVALMLHGSSPSSQTSTRQICYPPVSSLRKCLLSPAMNSFLSSSAATGSTGDGNSATTVNTFPAFSSDVANNMLFEAQEYVQGQEKLCTSTAFVYHRIPMNRIKTTFNSGGNGIIISTNNNNNSSSIDFLASTQNLEPSNILGLNVIGGDSTSSSPKNPASGGGDASSKNYPSEFLDNVSTNSPCFVTLWLMCHLLPEEGVTVNAPKRLLDLANAASILARWSEMCLRGDGNFRFYVAGGGNNNNKQKKVWNEMTLAFVGSALDECAGEFGDCRHAVMELRFAGE